MAAVVFVGGRRLRNEAHVPPTKTSRHETTTNGKPGLAAQNINSLCIAPQNVILQFLTIFEGNLNKRFTCQPNK
ncbi:MAG: hypothetical protein B6D64_07075 [Bacteroidetes bacterium 4484_276]|nr:MAG: hypothetical protein B6D64_07075 [Bacteroidetes bacterium 4484_276]OYT12798.1 MAG: hypothetical protein B6I19_08485 [Bacteroidetes bacterium 4572_114]